ncbi:MAG: YbgC/FadM family acyl-CoA thioesterase [Fibrobacter sp.]|nr:YbgC/FadM family acyl-CoA thioesterase [Fibrobacter sp.]
MKIRIYYEDTDCGNVVYYANYLKFMERSRTEFLRERGIDLASYHKKGYLFVVVDAHIKYRAPAYYNDLLDAVSFVTELTSVSVSFTTNITSEKGRLLVKGDIRLACVNSNGRACRIPHEISEALVK